MKEIYVLLVNNKTLELDEHDIMVFDNLEILYIINKGGKKV